jgi:molybdate transport system regulatory protein
MQYVRFRVDLGPGCSIGPGKIELLEAIARTGSIRQAARAMRMSYRRAWLLVDSLNQSFRERSTSASVGGAGGGGVELTPFGEDLVRRYRKAAKRIDMLAMSEFATIARKLTTERPPAGHKRLSKTAAQTSRSDVPSEARAPAGTRERRERPPV